MYMSNPDWRMFIPPLPKHSGITYYYCTFYSVIFKSSVSTSGWHSVCNEKRVIVKYDCKLRILIFINISFNLGKKSSYK